MAETSLREASRSISEREESDDDDAPMTCPQQCFYYCFAFCALWFGPKAVDYDGDGKFTPRDAKLAYRNFTSSDKSSSGPRTPRVGDPNVFEMMYEDNEMLDGFEAVVEGERYAEQMTEFPWFIIGQSCFALLVWFAGMTYNCSISDDSANVCEAGWTANLAGFITLPAPVGPNSVLAFHGMDCTSYQAQVWRLVTYQWTHTGLAHVSMNVMLNIVLGVPLGAFNGWLRMFIMYNGGVVGAALVVSLFDVHSTVVGMSGGCYALIGEKIADLGVNWHQKAFRWAELAFLMAIIGADSFFSLVLNPVNKASSSIVCHIGGLYCGIVLGLVFARNLLETPGEILVRRLFVGVTVCAGIGLAVWKCFYHPFPPQNIFSAKPAWCSAMQISDFPYFNDSAYHCIFCEDDPACWQQWSARSSAYLYNVSYTTCKALEGEHGEGWNTYGPPVASV